MLGGCSQPPAGVSEGDFSPSDQLPPAGVALVATLLNVLFAFEPRVVMAAMQTTMIRASITAYSTAVGPSSRLRKFTNFFARLRISLSPGAWRLSLFPLCFPFPVVTVT